MQPQLRSPRLKRLDRLFVSHPLYFVTACTEDRKPILANAKVHEDLRRFCEAGMGRGVFVGKYVLMPDHLHLFVAFGDEYEAALVAARLRRSQTDATGGVGRSQTDALAGVGVGGSQTDALGVGRSQTDAVAGVGGSQIDATNVRRDNGAPVAAVCDRRFSPLSEWMKSLKNSLSKTLRGMNIPAPHWQKGFFEHVMRSEESYPEKWLYVAENPVRKHLVARPEDWAYQGEIYPLQARVTHCSGCEHRVRRSQSRASSHSCVRSEIFVEATRGMTMFLPKLRPRKGRGSAVTIVTVIRSICPNAGHRPALQEGAL